MIKNIVLDFGHGGVDENGHYTTAPNKMYTFPDGEVVFEGVLNRQIGWNVYDCLKEHSELNVVSTIQKGNPVDVSLSNRVKLANSFNYKETIFVSIHCNASPSHNASGFEIYTTIGQTKSDELADDIATCAEFALKKNNVRLRYDLGDDDKDKESDFYVLRKTRCAAVLIECGFFDNRKDLVLLKDPVYQGDLGSFIATGIIKYINEQNK